jgi:hypothetical protein
MIRFFLYNTSCKTQFTKRFYRSLLTEKATIFRYLFPGSPISVTSLLR